MFWSTVLLHLQGQRLGETCKQQTEQHDMVLMFQACIQEMASSTLAGPPAILTDDFCDSP
jgi:hypothetical protein